MEIDKNLKETITKKIKKEYEGKCIVEGYIKNDSCEIISYSSGLIKGVNIIYDVIFKCKTCFPVEGMNINCIAINITKSAGIRAEIAGVKPSPAVIFITRDHHYNDDYFSQIQEGQTFSATVIGQRFELNDKFISIIAKLIQPSSEKVDSTKPRFVEDEEPQNEKPQVKSKTPKNIVIPKTTETPTTREKSRIILSDDDEVPIGEDVEEEMVLVPKQFQKGIITSHTAQEDELILGNKQYEEEEEEEEEELVLGNKKSDEEEVFEGDEQVADEDEDDFEEA
jgi:DNA-directed RNA polymerase subunit E'/Rpb7